MIEIRDLVKKYNSNETFIALDGVNLEFGNTGLASVLGASGSGKSTLLNLIGLLDKPTSGEIIINGVSIKSLTDVEEDKCRNQIFGFIFQSYHLIPTLSLLDNVILPLEVSGTVKEEEQKELGIRILTDLGLGNAINKKVNELSGGMKQRVAIARALIKNPEIILADEPTGALDSKNSADVLKLLKRISKTKLVILVTHNEKEAEIYSDRIIRMSDGNVISDTNANKHFGIENESFIINNNQNDNLLSHKNRLMKFKNVARISFKSFMSKKLKTILTSVANCFGLVALGFVLAITNGFSIYKNNVDSSTASNLPINVPAYSVKSDTESFEEVNESTKYPEKEEIYPFVNGKTKVTYTYNNYSPEYFKMLDELKSEGLIQDYLFNYGNDYTYNISTAFPSSINHKYNEMIGQLNTNISAGGSYTNSTYGIPTNIFHVLYGDIDNGYDLIAGKMPKDNTDLVLVVDEYNEINFDTLKNLGFYNLNDSMEDIKLTDGTTKVRPISFNDIIGKKYKIFTNDEIYTNSNKTYKIYDQFSYKFDTLIQTAKPRELSFFKTNELRQLYNDESKGMTLTISGILRPKKDSTLSLISPSLCFLPGLQTELDINKKSSEISSKLKNNVVYLSDDPNSNLDLEKDVKKLLSIHKDDLSTITATEINEIANKFFKYYPIDHTINDGETPIATQFTSFLNDAKRFGVNLINEGTSEALSSGNNEVIEKYILELLSYFQKSSTSDLAYEHFISLVAFINSYSDILNVAIFPTGLFERSVILKKLDEYNDSMLSEKDKIYYYDNSNYMIETVGNMVSLISLVLLIFVVVLLVVACVMNILFTYNNVLERKKDIGIFRAIGMRKMDVSRVFIFEASIIGTLSGLMSCLLTYLLSFPVNYEVKQYYTAYYNIGNICVLSWWHIVLLILLGLILGVLSAIIPANYAANKDPVKCLKDE